MAFSHLPSSNCVVLLKYLKAKCTSLHLFMTLHMQVCDLLSQYFWKYAVFKKALNFRNHIIPKFKIRQNPLNENVIAVPHNKVTVFGIYNVKLSLNLVVVVMTPVQCDIIPVIDEAEALSASTRAQIGLILLRVWALISVARTYEQ